MNNNQNYHNGDIKTLNRLRVCFFGTYDQNFSSNQMVLRGLKDNGVEVTEVNLHTPVTLIGRKEDISWLKLLRRVLRKWRFLPLVVDHWSELNQIDAIYIGYPGHFDTLLAWPVAKILKKKLIYNPLFIFYTGFSEEQGILNKQSFMGQLAKWGEGTVFKLVDLVLADTPYQKQHLTQLFNLNANKIQVLPVGADERIYKYSPYHPSPNHELNVVYYGLYSPIHGLEHLIEAARILRNESKIKFTLIGKGNKYQETYSLVKKYGLERVTFLTSAFEKDQIPLLQQADIFLGFLQKHPSVDRIIPNKVYQGMALGKAVLTAESPVTRSMFQHGENMYFCQAGDSEDIAKKIMELKDDQLRLKIAANAYQLFQTKYSSVAVGKQLVEFINTLN